MEERIPIAPRYADDPTLLPGGRHGPSPSAPAPAAKALGAPTQQGGTSVWSTLYEYRLTAIIIILTIIIIALIAYIVSEQRRAAAPPPAAPALPPPPAPAPRVGRPAYTAEQVKALRELAAANRAQAAATAGAGADTDAESGADAADSQAQAGEGAAGQAAPVGAEQPVKEEADGGEAEVAGGEAQTTVTMLTRDTNVQIEPITGNVARALNPRRSKRKA